MVCTHPSPEDQDEQHLQGPKACLSHEENPIPGWLPRPRGISGYRWFRNRNKMQAPQTVSPQGVELATPELTQGLHCESQKALCLVKCICSGHLQPWPLAWLKPCLTLRPSCG